MPNAVAEYLAHQQDSNIRARVTGTQRGCHEDAGDPRPLSPPRKRHGLPDRQPSYHRTRLPGPHRPGKLRGPPGGHTGMHARLGAPRQAWIRPGTPSSGYPHRSLAPIPVRYASVDPATSRSKALQGEACWDRAETARLAENSQPAGRFRRWWQVLGSNQRRLSRRFYRPLPLATRATCLVPPHRGSREKYSGQRDYSRREARACPAESARGTRAQVRCDDGHPTRLR